MTSFVEHRINCKTDSTHSAYFTKPKGHLGRIFNIQRYSLNDGKGIRTVIFFKGCAHRCPWCANPESISYQPQLVRRLSKCIHNDLCSNDPKECPSGALEWIGYDISLHVLIDKILKDEIFYRTSGGGVTLSGGEVLLQAEFASQLLKELKRLGISTAIETAGDCNFDDFYSVAQYCDEVLFDFKIMDETKAKRKLHIHLDRVLSNFQRLYEKGINLIPRLPLIPTYTLSMENVEKVLRFLHAFAAIEEVHILPFHQFGTPKYELINKPYALKNLPTPEESDIEPIKHLIEERGYRVVQGG
ncbi:[formate-C-acetyltransferase]-activating enzyme [Necropsobacter massiliensis]|uniref:[formate-C-acetyltransferase]-activating enzyme n=1 Tax=Necropsobacter massiliensis TaxID=1400001 RepID=UPI000595F351|nr:[formate-C-acetyltransferase]-activating enzyme [Necropsobacter massiliensis]